MGSQTVGHNLATELNVCVCVCKLHDNHTKIYNRYTHTHTKRKESKYITKDNTKYVTEYSHQIARKESKRMNKNVPKK